MLKTSGLDSLIKRLVIVENRRVLFGEPQHPVEIGVGSRPCRSPSSSRR
jgi:hypothetical protein